MNKLLAMGAPTYVLERVQWVPGEMADIFHFFEDPANLPRITPPELGFQILNMSTDDIRSGSLIDYRLKWYGIPYHWRTRIEKWVPGERFTDMQLRGPYILWHHTHTFEEKAGGILLRDRVEYRLPFGILGSLLHTIIVKSQLKHIFDYRQQLISELLSGGKLYIEPPS